MIGMAAPAIGLASFRDFSSGAGARPDDTTPVRQGRAARPAWPPAPLPPPVTG